MFDVCVLGHVTREVVRTAVTERELPGGAAYYSALALHSLGANVSVLTKLGELDRRLLSEFEDRGITIFSSTSPTTTSFLNVYRDDSDRREQWVQTVALPFSVEDLTDVEARVFHLGPLTSGEIPIEVIRAIAKRGTISLDAQGFVRGVPKSSSEWQKVGITKWKERDEALPYINILKVNEEEARILSDQHEVEDLAAELSSLGPNEVIITRGSSPSLIYNRGRSYWIDAFPPRNLIDPTGSGDTFMAGYLYYRERTDRVEEIGKFAAVTASLKLSRHGPFLGTEQDVRDFADEIQNPLLTGV